MTEQGEVPESLGIERRRRRRWPWYAGAAGVLVIVGALIVVNTFGGDRGAFGTTLSVATWSTDLATEKVVEFVAEEIAPDYGIVIENRRIDDLVAINEAVVDGEVAANLVHYRPVLTASLLPAGFKIEGAAKVFTWKQGEYSHRYASWNDVPDGAKIGIRDDPAGQSIALLGLAGSGQITLDAGHDTLEDLPSLRDISSNPKGYEFVQVPIGQLARSYEDLDVILGGIGDVYSAGLPNDELIGTPPSPEGAEALLLVGSEYTDDPNLKKLIAAFSDDRIQTFLRTTDDPIVRDTLGPVGND